MSRIHRRVPPKGSKIGVAFSGGLDTRCAVAWFARNGLEVYAYTADLAQPDEERRRTSRRSPSSTARRRRGWSTAATRWCARG